MFGREQKARDVEDLNAGYRYALSLCAHQHDAEDLVHEAWIRLRQQYPGQAKRSLFFTIIRNLYIDQYRRRRLLSFSEFDEQFVPLPEYDLEASLIAATDLNGLLVHLRDIEREALFLSVVEGYTAEEIARMTGSTRGTVLSLLHRSKAKLRRMIGEQEDQTAEIIDLVEHSSRSRGASGADQ